jgi:hypothetical protein
MDLLAIQLPNNFTQTHQQVVIQYLTGALSGRNPWRTAFQAFDRLDEAIVMTSNGRYTFRALYLEMVDYKLADGYIQELLTLSDVKTQSTALWSRYARQIVMEFQQRGWQSASLPGVRLLLGYFLYWWGSFARGYAFEVEIYRDLQNSQVQFQAHNLLNRQERYSHSDLVVSGQAGDIKTSLYFVQVATPFQHDFYIVRLWVRGRSYTIAVMLRPPAWDEINGDAVEGQLAGLFQSQEGAAKKASKRALKCRRAEARLLKPKDLTRAIIKLLIVATT